MFEILVITTANLGDLAPSLNELKERGFRPVYFWAVDSRLVVVLEKPKVGRPRNTEDSNLGD